MLWSSVFIFSFNLFPWSIGFPNSYNCRMKLLLIFNLGWLLDSEPLWISILFNPLYFGWNRLVATSEALFYFKPKSIKKIGYTQTMPVCRGIIMTYSFLTFSPQTLMFPLTWINLASYGEVYGRPIRQVGFFPGFPNCCAHWQRLS